MKLNKINIILIILIIVFAYLYFTKPVEIEDTVDNTELLTVIREQQLLLERADLRIDSINNLLTLSKERTKLIESKLKYINKKYNEQINNINSQFIDADVDFFCTRFLSDSISN